MILSTLIKFRNKTLHSLFAVFFFISASFHGQSFEINPVSGKDTINYIDANGKKQRKWIIFGKLKPKSCYSAQDKVEEGNYSDNKKTGKWTEYHCNGNLKSRIEYQSGRPDGYCIMYSEVGKIVEEGTWKNNRWIGKYKQYYENGNVQHEFQFNQNGKREGEQVYHYESGEVMIKGNWLAGKENGVISEYNLDGTIKKTTNFNNGEADLASVREFNTQKTTSKKIISNEAANAPNKSEVIVKKAEEVDPGKVNKGPLILEGYHTTYYNKMLSKQGIFKKNVLIDGKAFFYDENGLLTRIAVYKDGFYVGDAPIEDQ
jgi:antitoxin component YwqK of YwqJK toxin-antitoxin module